MKKRVFFDTKNLLVLLSAVVGVYLIINLGMISCTKYEQVQRRNQIAAEQARQNALSSAERAIRRAETYQAYMITTAGPAERLFFDYIQRRFKLDERLSVAKTPLMIPEHGGSPQELDYLARVAFPDDIEKTAPVVGPDSNTLYTNIYAANCDIFPLSDTFWAAMERGYQEGGYSLTHVALALQFIKDNDCKMPSAYTDLEDRVTLDMQRLVNKPAIIADLRYEAIAFLLLTGNRDLVKQEWMQQIVKEQLPDGGWASEVGNKAPSSHATLLALWALLQYERNVPYQPLIRHPSQ